MSEWRYEYGKGWSPDEFAWWVTDDTDKEFRDVVERNGYQRYPSWTMGEGDNEFGIDVYAQAGPTHPHRPRWVVLVDEPGGGGVLVAVNDLPSLLALLREVEILTRNWRDAIATDLWRWLGRQERRR